jgi:SAM-dependent methyltransferase
LRHAADPVAFFAALEDYMEGLKPRARASEWSQYSQAPTAIIGQRDSYDAKQRAVDDYLADLAPGSVLDVGANAGWFSELAARHGHRVVALDTDDVTCCRLFERARRSGLPILPLRVDVMWPTGSHGLALAHAAAPERLRADISLWLAVLHHLVGRQGYGFEVVARVIDEFTRRTAIVEFIPRDDRYVREWQIASDAAYDVSAFIDAMAPYFPTVRSLPSSPDPRVMLRFDRA